MNLPGQMAVLAAAGGLLGLLANPFSPHPVALGNPIYAAAESGAGTCASPHGEAATAAPEPLAHLPARQAISLCEACTAGFVDARPASEFVRGHIPNAVHLPPHALGDEGPILQHLRAFSTIVVYDSGAGCDLAEAVARHLQSEGFADVRLLEGAWPDWERLGAPALSGACAACAGHP